MKTVEINYIDLENNDLALKTANYPKSGLFITRLKDGFSDLRFVDKKNEYSYVIAPELIFNECVTINESSEYKFLEDIEIKNNNFDADFILEFSRILLNRK